MLTHFLEHRNLEKWKFVFKCQFAKVVDIIHHSLLDTYFRLYGYTGFLEHHGRFPCHLISFLLQRVAKKIPGFEALKVVPFYKTFTWNFIRLKVSFSEQFLNEQHEIFWINLNLVIAAWYKYMYCASLN